MQSVDFGHLNNGSVCSEYCEQLQTRTGYISKGRLETTTKDLVKIEIKSAFTNKTGIEMPVSFWWIPSVGISAEC